MARTPAKPTTFVQIGAFQFPVKLKETSDNDTIIRADFSKYRIKGSPDFRMSMPVTRHFNSQTVKEDRESSGLWLNELLNLVDKNDNSAPMLVLSLDDIDPHDSRIVQITRDDNEPGDGPGGHLWLRVEEKLRDDLNTAAQNSTAPLSPRDEMNVLLMSMTAANDAGDLDALEKHWKSAKKTLKSLLG